MPKISQIQPHPTWMSVKSAARYCDMSTRSFRDLLKNGLRYSRLPSGRIKVKTEWLDDYMNQYEQNTPCSDIECIVNGVLSDIARQS